MLASTATPLTAMASSIDAAGSRRAPVCYAAPTRRKLAAAVLPNNSCAAAERVEGMHAEGHLAETIEQVGRLGVGDRLVVDHLAGRRLAGRRYGNRLAGSP